MAHQIIAEYKNALIEGNLGEDYLNDNQDAKVIRINTCSKKIGALYLDADHFNACTIDFIKKMKSAKQSYTDPYFNFQIVNAHNIIYLDGDWMDDEGKTVEEYRETCTSVAVEDMKLALAFLEKNHINVEHRHIWVPTVFPITNNEAKMGYHSFIICEENIDSDMRKSFLDYVKTNCTYGESVLDESPVKTTQSLLPFATKVRDGDKLSRAYYLTSKLLKFDLKCNHYANAAVQNTPSSNNGDQLDIPIGIDQLRFEEEDTSENEHAEEEQEIDNEEEEAIQVDFEEEEEQTEPLELDPLVAEMTKRPDNDTTEEPVKISVKRTKQPTMKADINALFEAAIKKAHSKFKESGWTYRYGVSNRIAFEFIDSLRYLRPKHRFFRMLADNDARVKRVFPAIMRYLYVNYTIDTEGQATMDVGTMIEIMLRLMTPLIERAFKYFKNDGKRRNIEAEIRQTVPYWFQKYGVDGMFKPTNKNKETYDLLSVYRDYLINGKGDKRKRDKWVSDRENVYDVNDQLWIKHWINKKKNEYNYVAWGREYLEPLTAETVYEGMQLDTPQFVVAGEYRRRRFDKFCEVCRKQVKRWIGFVKDIIMDGITKEIKPFNAEHNDISFDEAFPEDFSADPYNYGSISHYVKIIRLWCLMFLFTGFYEAQDLCDAVRMIMTAFTRKFIWIDMSKKEPVTWLYNIKQTDSLEAYPYNQWIEDPKGSETEQWMSVIYDRFIRPLLLTIDRSNNIDSLMGTMENAGIGLDGRVMNKLKPFGNLGTEISTICKNVFKTFGGNPRPKMLHAAQADYFPMRNGWLKWIIKDGQPTGEYEFLTDTHGLYMGRYTQVQWAGPLEEYDKNCIEYKAVKRVIEQIYPDEEGREYCMRQFASVLYGTGYKDRLFVMYGTGSDGKTTIVNAVQALLGQSGFGADATVKENGKYIALNRNLKGLASTMKAEALLVNASAKSSHDEGGISEAVDVRLCNTQEPQLDNKGRVTLNGATIKGILSGTASSTRKIYQEATSSVINALIIMQTNYKPYVDDSTDGLKRRFTMYQHKSKFITNESSSFKNTEYHFKADAGVAKALTDEPRYWQALFYILLEYAQKNLRERILPLSKLPMPPCVKDACDEIFSKYVVSVMGAITNVIEKVGDDELGIIHFNDFKKQLKEWNGIRPAYGQEPPNHPYGFCEAHKADDIDKEIIRGMVQYFGGNMYRLKETPTQVISDTEKDYRYTSRKRGSESVVYTIKDVKGLVNFAIKNGYNTDRFMTEFLRESAMSTLDQTGGGKIKDEANNDVYIVGWRLIDLKAPAEEVE